MSEYRPARMTILWNWTRIERTSAILHETESLLISSEEDLDSTISMYETMEIMGEATKD